jgi:hypothetical protein
VLSQLWYHSPLLVPSFICESTASYMASYIRVFSYTKYRVQSPTSYLSLATSQLHCNHSPQSTIHNPLPTHCPLTPTVFTHAKITGRVRTTTVPPEATARATTHFSLSLCRITTPSTKVFPPWRSRNNPSRAVQKTLIGSASTKLAHRQARQTKQNVCACIHILCRTLGHLDSQPG